MLIEACETCNNAPSDSTGGANPVKVLTPEQAAEVLQLTPATVYKYLREGRLPGRKVGGKSWRILESELEAYLCGDWPKKGKESEQED